MKYDVVVVGTGFTGSVIARQLADANSRNVLLIEKRSHIAGNMYDESLENNVLIHKYGPHSFFTDDESLVAYIKRYGEWKELDVTAEVCIDEKNYSLPFGFNFIREYYSEAEAELLIDKLKKSFPNQERVAIYDLLDSSDDDIAHFAHILCEKDYYPYASKQWGLPMSAMDPSVISRVKFALSEDNRYIQQKYQYTPVEGFTKFFSNLLNTKRIDIKNNIDALDYISFENNKAIFNWNGMKYTCPIVFTGPIDELFECKYGKLPYRSLDIVFKSFNKDSYQNSPFVSYPQAEGYTRIVEYKKLTGQKVDNVTTISIEYPKEYKKGENLPYYPVINEENIRLFQRYKNEATKYENLYVCGRLGDYKYYNMDAAIMRAMEIADQIEESIRENENAN